MQIKRNGNKAINNKAFKMLLVADMVFSSFVKVTPQDPRLTYNRSAAVATKRAISYID